MIFLIVFLQVSAVEFSVSGFSSGAFMAMQLHLAHSQLISGIGMVAGGPYHCSKSTFPKSACTKFPLLINTTELIEYAKSQEILKNIDALSNIKNSKIFLQSGTKDTIVHQGASKKVQEFYNKLGGELKAIYDIPSHHTFLTDSYGNPCWFYGKPYISDCGFDTAGEILSHIYGKLNARTVPFEENLLEFSQVTFGSDQAGMSDTGYIYVPSICKLKNLCRIHIFLHGCGMNSDYISDALTRHSGYNSWAESNNIIIIYPQAARHHPLNPGACWDALGGQDSSFSIKSGLQVNLIYKMSQNVHSLIFP